MNVAIRRCAWAARASTFCAASAGMGYSMRAACGLALLCPPAGCRDLRVLRRNLRSHAAIARSGVNRRGGPVPSSPLLQCLASCMGLVARQHPAHGIHELRLRNGNLRGAGLAPLLGIFDGGSGLGALDQILDLDLAARDLVRSLDDDARGAALVCVLHLRLHAGGAE